MKRGRPRGSVKRGPKRDETIAANVDLIHMLKGEGITAAASDLQRGVYVAALRVAAEHFERWRADNGIPSGRWLTHEEIAKGVAAGILDRLAVPPEGSRVSAANGGNVASLLTRYYRAPNRRNKRRT
jgi:hypothetical protein